MILIKYFGLKACYEYGFPYIYDELTEAEKAPIYEAEPEGIAELEKVLHFVQIDDYYPTFEDNLPIFSVALQDHSIFQMGTKDWLLQF